MKSKKKIYIKEILGSTWRFIFEMIQITSWNHVKTKRIINREIKDAANETK
jgi:hypothetical protein